MLRTAAVATLVALMGAGAARAECPSDEAMAALAAEILAKQPAKAPSVETMEDALCAQGKLVEALQAEFGEPVGYKAGLTSQPAQERFGASEPVRGVLLEGMLMEDGATLPAQFGARPLFEADLIVTIADAAVNEATTPEEVLQHVSEVRPFIELPDLVVAEGEPLNGTTITAINVGARHGVMGDPVPVEQTPEYLQALADMTVRLTDASGTELAAAPGKAVLGHPLNSVLWLMENGVRLEAGDLVSVGSFGPLVPAKPGEVTASYEGLPGDPTVSVTLE